jgi:hypothetical protein
MNRRAVLTLFFSIVVVGCNFTNTPQPTLEIVSTPQPSFTPIPLPTFTPTPVTVSLQVSAELINCRSGAGTVFETLTEIQQGRLLTAVARNFLSTWFYVKNPGNPAGFCWVSADVIQLKSVAELLPIMETSAAIVTNVALRVEPNRIVVSCDQFPQTVFFEALVTTNGPALFTWKWEISTGVVSDVGTLIFEEAGTQAINEFYQINSANDYWVKLYVLTPNEIVEQVNFPVTCT